MTINLQALKGEAGTEWQDDWESLIDYTEGGLNEIETARQGQANLNAKITAMDSATTTVTNEVVTGRQGQASLTLNFDRYVLKTGLVSNFSGNNYRITTIADATSPLDAVNLQQVQSLISGGGSPSNIAVTSLNKGTATSLQLYRVNAGETAIEGINPVIISPNIEITSTNKGIAQNTHIIGVQNGVVTGRNLTYDLMFYGAM